MEPKDGPLIAALGSFFVGFGMGLTSTSFIVLIQNMVSWEQRGIATASNQFMLSIGNTVGVALLGGILNSRFQAYLTKHTSPSENVTLDTANQLLDPVARNQLPNDVVTVLQTGLTLSLHSVYLIVLLFAIISFILLLFVGKKQVKENVEKNQGGFVMSFSEFQLLSVLAQEMNMRKAAERLFVSQPALSQRLQTIEKDWGTKLFIRSQKGLSLTPAGEAVIRFANEVRGKRGKSSREYSSHGS